MPEIPIEIIPGEGLTLIPTPPTPEPPVITPTPPPVVPEPPPVPVPPTDVIGPQSPGGLPELGILATLLLILALIALGSALNEFFNWLFRRMLNPFSRFGKPPTNTAPQFTQKLSNALGNAYVGIEGEIGASFTKLATLEGRRSHIIVKAASVVHQIAQRIARLEGYTQATNAAQQQAKQDTAAAAAQAARAGALAAQTATALTHEHGSVTARLTALEQHVTHLIEPELEALRDRIPKLEHGATVAWDEIVKHEALLGEAAVTALVAGGISRIGADWIKCEANNLLGKAACRKGPDLFRKLLTGALDVLALSQLCRILGVMAATANSAVIKDAIHYFTRGVTELIKCRGVSMAQPLTLPPVALAPATPFAALAPVSV
jgi:hypothetical protein